MKYLELFFYVGMIFFTSTLWAIYNGEPTHENSPSFRSQIKLYRHTRQGYEYLCSGVLIKNDAVLTAGHCLIDDDGKPFKLQVGFEPIQLMTSEVRIQVLRQYLHPLYESHQRRTINDLGLIFLKGEAPSPYVPAKILTSPELFVLPAQVQIAGSGFYGFKDPLIGFSRKDNLFFNKRHTIIRTAMALEHKLYDPYKINYPSELGEVTHPDGSLCPGDSGGPHYAFIQEQWQLIGITSSTSNNCISGEAKAVHVGGYLNWLESTLQKHYRTSLHFGFSDQPEAAEWKSTIFPTNFQVPNKAQSPHYTCELSESANGFKAPQRVNLSLVSLRPHWRTSRYKGQFLFYDLSVDIEIENNFNKSYFSGRTKSKTNALTPLLDLTRVDFDFYPHQLLVDFPKKKNNGIFQIYLVDEDSREAQYHCTQQKTFRGQLSSDNDLRFFDQDLSIYSAIAMGGKICEVPKHTMVSIDHFTFDHRISTPHIKLELSSEQPAPIPSCLRSNAFLVDGAYGIEF